MSKEHEHNGFKWKDLEYRPKYYTTKYAKETLHHVKYTGPQIIMEDRHIELYPAPLPLLVLTPGYQWDGPSGPTIDTAESMRGSAVHDALYALIQAGHLPMEQRIPADKELLRCLREDGMSWVRRRLWFRAVKRFGASHAQ